MASLPQSVRRVALVTGASRGLGAAIARMLAVQLGMSVVINYAGSKDRAEGLVANLRETCGSSPGDLPPPRFQAIQADLSKKSEVIRLVQETADAMDGRLDVVISNVGWTRMRDFYDLDDGVDEEDWDRTFAVNVKSPLWIFHAARQLLEESNTRHNGAAVFVSTASVAGCKPSGSSLPYAVTKAAQIHLVRSLAIIAAPSIRVNSVSPGVLLTDWGNSFSPERLEAVKNQNKLKRFASIDNVVEQVRCFVRSETVTGQNAIIDAGFSL